MSVSGVGDALSWGRGKYRVKDGDTFQGNKFEFDCSGFTKQYTDDILPYLEANLKVPEDPTTIVFNIPPRPMLSIEEHAELHTMKTVLLSEVLTCQRLLDDLGNGGVNDESLAMAQKYLALRHETVDVMASVIERLVAAEQLQYGAQVEAAKASLQETLEVANSE